MGRNGLMGNFQGFDAFGKVSPDAAIAATQADRVDNGRRQDPYEDRRTLYAYLSLLYTDM